MNITQEMEDYQRAKDNADKIKEQCKKSAIKTTTKNKAEEMLDDKLKTTIDPSFKKVNFDIIVDWNKILKKIGLILSIVILTNCSYFKEMHSYTKDNWYTWYELTKIVGKEEAKKIIENCREIYTNEFRTIRDNMKTGNIEYYIIIEY